MHLVHAAEEELRPVNLGQDLEELKARISEAPAPRLLIVSALNDYLPAGVNPDKDIEIRRVLRPLSLFAEQCGVALCCLLHVGKATDRKAQHRQLGSVAYMNLPRIALGAVAQASAEGPTLGIFGGLKNNLGKRGPSLCYRITDTGLQWDGPSPVDIKNALQQDGLVPSGPGPGRGRPPNASNVAKAFLKDQLGGRPDGRPAPEMRQLAKEHEIADTTLWRARQDVGVSVLTRPGQGEMWFMPPRGEL